LLIVRTRVQKWGNSLAVRIPRALAAEAALGLGTRMELSVVEGKLVIAPVAEPEFTLELLLGGITEENIHSEVDWGPAVGHEAW
jgi:antitoxin MazE